ncbi:hypothetical protein FGO68_gene7098 [Halteria grandinella]|uniref:Uncharacterized protein n=1 Tax=Halteria grandinella TaxID=5974 RepID=A0A8J8P4I2_HALGN|nr:hypothetical protein FGO68_gene7098 [Halteria grandinella]
MEKRLGIFSTWFPLLVLLVLVDLAQFLLGSYNSTWKWNLFFGSSSFYIGQIVTSLALSTILLVSSI